MDEKFRPLIEKFWKRETAFEQKEICDVCGHVIHSIKNINIGTNYDGGTLRLCPRCRSWLLYQGYLVEIIDDGRVTNEKLVRPGEVPEDEEIPGLFHGVTFDSV